MPGFSLFCDGLSTLAPLTDLRPAFDVRTGARTTLERITLQLAGKSLHGLMVPPHLAPIAKQDHRSNVVDRVLDQPVLLINARLPMLTDRSRLLELGEAITESGSGHLVAAHCSPEAARAFLAGADPGWRIVEQLPAPTLISRPWHVRAFRDACLKMDLEKMLESPAAAGVTGIVCFGSHPLHIDPLAKVYPTAVFDLENGPIVIAEEATIRPGAILIGPCYVGPHSTVLERATIRQHTSIGPWCKINGEVGGTIFQGFTNKAHDGYVGDSYIGEWVNLGAGTTTSNLLNTYGEVISKAAPASSHERTGLQFLGAIIGDHTKTAICTRLMTGSVIHTGAMIATTAAANGCIHPFAWMTDAGARTYRLEKFVEVLKAAMKRRNVTPTAEYIARVAELHAWSLGAAGLHLA